MTLHLIDTSVVCYNLISSLSALTPNQAVPDDMLETYADAVRLSADSLEALFNKGDRVLWLADGTQYFRKKINPNYKAGRLAKPDCYDKAISVLKTHTGAIAYREYEADDLIARVALDECVQDQDVFIHTNDSDLIQLVSPRCTWSSLDRHEPLIRDWGSWQDWFIKRKIAKKYWSIPNATPYSAICSMKWSLGDKSDNYPKFSPTVMFDLTVSPVFEAVSSSEVENWVDNAKIADPAKGRASESLLKQNFCLPPHYHNQVFGWAS